MSKVDKLSDAEKANLALKGIESFFENFGDNDACRQILLEIIMEQLYGQNIHISGTTGQEGNKDNY